MPKLAKARKNKFKIEVVKKHSTRWLAALEAFSKVSRKEYNSIKLYITKHKNDFEDKQRKYIVKMIRMLFLLVTKLAIYLAEIDNYIQSLDFTNDDDYGIIIIITTRLLLLYKL